MLCCLLSPIVSLPDAGCAVASVPTVRQFLLAGTVAAGSVGRGAVVIFSYDPAPEGVERTATAATGLVNPVAVAITPDQRLYIADDSADPLRLQGSLGAVWVVDPAGPVTAAAKLVAANSLFRTVADLVLEPEGTILLLDSDADPHEWGAQNGAIFRIDPSNGNVTVLAGPQAFLEPRSMTVDSDSTILVVDEAANPQGVLDPAGAIFRVNTRTGSVTTERSFRRGNMQAVLAPVAVAIIDQGEHLGDYLVLDSRANPFGSPTARGAVFRVPAAGGEPELYMADELYEFMEPVDILVGLDHDVYVLDRSAATDEAPSGKGAVFRFNQSDGVLLQPPKVSNSFRSLNGFTQLSGAQVDSSRVFWLDETPPLLRPGDFLTVRAKLRNTGTADAAQVSLTDTVRAPFQFVSRSDSVGSGQATFDPATLRFFWSGPLAQGDSTIVRFRLKLLESSIPGSLLQQRLVLRAGEASTTYLRRFGVQGEFDHGDIVFLDVVPPIGGQDPVGVLYAATADSAQPEVLRQGGLLQRPADSVFLEDGRLAILDPGSPGGELGAILVYSLNAADTLSVLLALRRELGFVLPAGLAVDRDGTLLIIDREANPNGYPYTPADPFHPDRGPGAVFRFDAVTRELSVELADSRFHEPADAVVDRRGALVVVDAVGGSQLQGSLWELPLGADSAHEIALDAEKFRSPTGVTVDGANNLFVCSFRASAGPNPEGGAIYKIHRGQAVTITTVSADTLLREPIDLTVGGDGYLLVADRAANPFQFGEYDRGAVFRLNPITKALTVVAASGLLRSPDGVASLAWPDFGASMLRFTNAGEPLPEDTLWVEAQLTNRGLRSSPQTLALLSFSSQTLRVLPPRTPLEGLSVDTLSNQVSWAGRVAWGDTVRFVVPSIVLSGNSFGAMAEVGLSVHGGRSPVSIAVSRAIRSEFLPHDLVLVDRDADPRRFGRPYAGAAFLLGHKANEKRDVIYSQRNLEGVAAAEWTPAGDLLLAADFGDSPGGIYRFDTATRTVSRYASAEIRMRTPVDMLYAPDGTLLVVDEDAAEFGLAAPPRGAIFSRAANGRISVYCADSLFRAPTQAALGPDGMIYLADHRANPEGAAGNTGAIFRIDPNTRQVVGWLQDPSIPEPTGITAYDDSTLLISDPIGAYPSTPNATLMLYRPQSAVPLDLLFSGGRIESLWRSLRRPSGTLLLLDREGQHEGQADPPHGLVLEFDPTTNRLTEFAWSDSFARVSDLVTKPGPVVTFARYVWSTPNGPPLHAADRIRWRAVLRNIGVLEASDVVYRDLMPTEAAVLPDSAEAIDGQSAPVGLISFEGSQALSWSGSIAPGDSVVISYLVQLNPAVSEGRLLTFHPVVTGPSGETVAKTVKLQIDVPLELGYAYVIDPTADPHRESATGSGGRSSKSVSPPGQSPRC